MTAVIHVVKCEQPWFDQIGRGGKTFDVRWDDRDYQEGDLLVLREWDPKQAVVGQDTPGGYVGPGGGHTITADVGFVMRTFPGLVPGWAVLSLHHVLGWTRFYDAIRERDETPESFRERVWPTRVALSGG